MKIGQKVWIYNEEREGEVTKVGKKYIYVKFSGREMKFHKDQLKDTLNEKCKLYLDKEEYEKQYEKKNEKKPDIRVQKVIELLIHEIQQTEGIHLSETSRNHIERLVKELELN